MLKSRASDEFTTISALEETTTPVLGGICLALESQQRLEKIRKTQTRTTILELQVVVRVRSLLEQI